MVIRPSLQRYTKPKHLQPLCLGDLDILSRLQLYENQKICVCFLANFVSDSDEIQYVATICWVVEAHAQFILTDIIQRREF